MKKQMKKLTALLLTFLLLMATAAPAMAADENISYGPLGYWNNITSDTSVSVIKTNFLDAFQFTCRTNYNEARFEQVFQDVVPGTYQVGVGYYNEDISAEVFINGIKMSLPANDSLEIPEMTLNVPTKMDVRVVARFRGAGTSVLIGPVLSRTGDPTPAPVPAENLLVNPSFENGLSGWTYTNEELTGIDTTFSQTGFNSAGLMYESHTGMDNYLAETVSAGTGSYTGSVSIFTEGAMNGLGAMVLLEAKDSEGNVLATAVSPAVNDTKNAWQEISATIEAPAETAQITMKVGGVYCTGVFYLDDARLAHTA